MLIQTHTHVRTHKYKYKNKSIITDNKCIIEKSKDALSKNNWCTKFFLSQQYLNQDIKDEEELVRYKGAV